MFRPTCLKLITPFSLGNNSPMWQKNLKYCPRHAVFRKYFSTPAKEPKESFSFDLSKFSISNCNYDIDYICNPQNHSEITLNIKNRKGVGNIDDVQDLWGKLNSLLSSFEKVDNHGQEEYFHKLLEEFLYKISQIPNRTHPDVIIGDESKARVLETVGQKKEFNFSPQTFEELSQKLDILHTAHLGHVSDNRSYFFKGMLANLEQALIRFCVDRLCKSGFTLMSVPDLLHPSTIEACGMMIRGDKNQIYFLDPDRHGNVCLSGTSEMALAGYFKNKCIASEDPQKLAAVSRCYRSEISHERGGIYRVHEFTKVEMFAVIAAKFNDESDILLNEMINIQKQLFTELGLHFRVLDMPSQELGAPAYRKYDIEAWMPGRSIYGEISSASNCTDFQSRRLNLTTSSCDKPHLRHFVHTLNATACAIPRMLIALLETHQQKDGSIHIVEALQSYFGGDTIHPPTKPLKLHWIKHKSQL